MVEDCLADVAWWRRWETFEIVKLLVYGSEPVGKFRGLSRIVLYPCFYSIELGGKVEGCRTKGG